MRVTRETLIRIAQETTKVRTSEQKDILAAYLIGSLLSEEPFLGGLTDIDLVFITEGTPPRTREIVRLTGDFHLDITYHARVEFDSPRQVRVNPWLGPEIYAPMLLYDRDKFFDFVQAAVRAGSEFSSPASVLRRCHTLLAHGRGIWTDLVDLQSPIGPHEVAHYLKAVYHAACAIAELNGNPLAERRLLLEFPKRAEQAGRPQLAGSLAELVGGLTLETGLPAEWLPLWQQDFIAAAESGRAEPRIHPARLNYYRRAYETLEGIAGLWPLLHTWTFAAMVLPPDQRHHWQTAISQLGLVGEAFHEKVAALDHFLDEVEILLDEIALANGLEPSSSLV